MNLDLFVDTSRKGISMALFDGSSNLYQETVDASARGETASTILDELLNRVDATLDDIKRVLVTVGPGSFSGLRTGVAFCQGLCFSGKRDLYGVSTLQALECFGDSGSVAGMTKNDVAGMTKNDVAGMMKSDVAVVIRARNGYWYLRQTINGEAQESFIETAEVVNRLKQASALKTVVVDDAAAADDTLKTLFNDLSVSVVIDAGKPLHMWSILFSKIKPNLIQEANYIQPSYFEKLKV